MKKDYEQFNKKVERLKALNEFLEELENIDNIIGIKATAHARANERDISLKGFISPLEMCNILKPAKERLKKERHEIENYFDIENTERHR